MQVSIRPCAAPVPRVSRPTEEGQWSVLVAMLGPVGFPASHSGAGRWPVVCGAEQSTRDAGKSGGFTTPGEAHCCWSISVLGSTFCSGIALSVLVLRQTVIWCQLVLILCRVRGVTPASLNDSMQSGHLLLVVGVGGHRRDSEHCGLKVLKLLKRIHRLMGLGAFCPLTPVRPSQGTSQACPSFADSLGRPFVPPDISGAAGVDQHPQSHYTLWYFKT